MRVAVVGPTGLVGQELLKVLAERNFPAGELVALGSARSAGGEVYFRGSPVPVREARPETFAGVDIAFFCVSGEVARELAPAAVGAGAVVIDKSSHFRMDPRVPLVVPEVNGHRLADHQGIVASPNCSTIQLVMAVYPLHRAAGLRRVVVATYQSVSGTGRAAVDELRAQARAVLDGHEITPGVYPYPIAFNVLVQCDGFGEGGYTAEELKLVRETRRILEIADLAVTATAVRVPVFVGHSQAVNVELAGPCGVADARAALAAFPGVRVVDDPAAERYPMPLLTAGRDEVFVGRIRRDETVPSGLNLWIVADNLRKGAATNAVQIAEALLAKSLLGGGRDAAGPGTEVRRDLGPHGGVAPGGGC